MTNLISLPMDIKLIVLDFLTIDECFMLQGVRKGFLNGAKSSFWAKKLFEKHIQNPDKLLNVLKYSDEKIPYYVPSFAEFDHFFSAQALWQGLMSNQKKVFNFFSSITKNNAEASRFVNRIYTILHDPSIPVPAMKRESQYLSTSSEFENFLTELHFDVRPHMNVNDQDYFMLKNTCEAIRESTTKSKNITLKNRSEKAGLTRRSPKYFLKYTPKNQRIIKQKANLSQERSTARRNKENNRLRIEGFLSIHDVVKSHCKIIRNYLSSLTEDRIILKEYKRCWKEFTYSMIEMNSLMQPYEELLASKDVSNFYKNGETVAFWKVMVNCWLSEVYNKVGLKIKTSFQNLLIDTITKEVIDNHPHFEENGKKLQFEVFNLENDDQDSPYYNDKIVRLLKKSFIALSDISLCKSGVNVLEWNNTSHIQPKIKLINFLYPRIKALLEETIEVFDKESSRVRLSQTLRNIQNIFDEVFNEEIGLQEHDGNEEEEAQKIIYSENSKDEEADECHVIAGQYKIISKCKWQTRLSQIHPRTESLACC